MKLMMKLTLEPWEYKYGSFLDSDQNAADKWMIDCLMEDLRKISKVGLNFSEFTFGYRLNFWLTKDFQNSIDIILESSHFCCKFFDCFVNKCLDF